MVGFLAIVPGVETRGYFQDALRTLVRFSRPLRLRSGQALRDGVGLLGIVPGVETPGYFQNVLRTLGAVQSSLPGRGWVSCHRTRR